MKFKTFYLNLPVKSSDPKVLDREKFARKCGTTRNFLTLVAHGQKPASAALAIAIERETAGVVRCEEVHPGRSTKRPHGTDWQYIRGTAKRSAGAACNA